MSLETQIWDIYPDQKQLQNSRLYETWFCAGTDPIHVA